MTQHTAVGPNRAQVVTKGLSIVAATELWWSLGLAGLLLFVGRAFWPILVLVPFLWLGHGVAHRRWLLSAPTAVPFLLFLAWLPVPVWASADWASTRVALTQILAGVILFVGLCHWAQTWHRLKVILWLLAAMVIGLAVASPFAVQRGGTRFFALPGLLEAVAKRFPESVNPNVLAGALALLLPLLLAVLLSIGWWDGGVRERRLLAAWLALALMVGLVTLALSRSYGAYLALAAAVAFLLALRGPRWRWFLLVLAAAGALAVVYWGPGRLAESLSAGQAVSSWQGRNEVWSRARYALADFPITGIGLGTFGQVIPLLYPYFIVAGADISHAHNLVLQVAVDVGWPGLAAYTALWAVIVVLTVRSYRRAQAASQGVWAALAAGLLGSYTALLVHGLVDAVSWSSKVAVVPWLLMGVAVALHGMGRES